MLCEAFIATQTLSQSKNLRENQVNKCKALNAWKETVKERGMFRGFSKFFYENFYITKGITCN